MSTGTSFIEKGSLAASHRCQLRTLDHCCGRDTQGRSSSPPCRIVNINTNVCVRVCVCEHERTLMCAFFYFLSCELEVSSQGFFEGLIYAQDLGLRLTLEGGLS